MFKAPLPPAAGGPVVQKDQGRRVGGIVCLVFGVVSLLLALSSFATRTEGSGLSYSLGTLVPSVLLLTAGVWLLRNAKTTEGPAVPLRGAKKWLRFTLATIASFFVVGLVLSSVFGKDPTPSERVQAEADNTLRGYIDGTQGVRGEGPGFSAVFPGPPELDSSVEDADGLDVTIHSLMDEVGGTAFGLQYTEYPPEADLSSPRLVLRSAAEAGAAAIEGKLTSFKQTTIEGRPAAFVLITGEMNARVRLIIDGQRLIFLQVASAQENAPGFTRFVESFRFDERMKV